ncbi:MAG: hypothetical protein ACRDOK_28735 [Streptosporangiaceae bacterium]
MTLGDSGQPGPGDVVQLGRSARSRPRWLGSILLACLVGVAAVVVGTRMSGPREPPPPPPVTVRDVGHPILGIRAGYELFGLDRSGVVDVRFARGQVIQTRVPPLQGDGIVSFVVARGEVLVRPLDRVPGYAIPDGRPARPLTGALAHGGILLPGPTSTQQWLAGDYLALVGPGGKAEPAHLGPAVPAAPEENVIPDGRGGLVLITTSGVVYDAGPGVLRPLNALLLAVGSRNWLGVICTEASCRIAVISAATGASRALPDGAIPLGSWPLESLPGGPWPWQALPGLAAPDGATAALIVSGQAEDHSSLELVSLSSGAMTPVPVPVRAGASSDSLAWSPDSHWLFVISTSGELAAVDARTGQVHEVGLGLSGLGQIVIRPASG